MRQKATDAVPDKIKDMVRNHDNEMSAEVITSPKQYTLAVALHNQMCYHCLMWHHRSCTGMSMNVAAKTDPVCVCCLPDQ